MLFSALWGAFSPLYATCGARLARKREEVATIQNVPIQAWITVEVILIGTDFGREDRLRVVNAEWN
jgi:hypothetical protein